jgi:hypothetical protein
MHIGLRTAISASVVVACASGLAGAPGPDGARQILDNDRVTVWDAPGPPGTSRPLGDVRFDAAGRRVDIAAGARTIVIDLKDTRVPPLANTSGYPNAFPRPGSKKVMENARVIVWDYTWTPGVATPMHFHDKDVVVVYLADGELLSTSPDGQRVNNPHSFGFTKFNTRDRVHTETLVKGQARAIIVELQ